MPRVLAVLLLGSLLMAPARPAAQIRVARVDSASTDVDPLAAPDGVRAVVFLFTATDCPISNRYAPEIQRIEKTFGPQGVLFRLIYPNPGDDAPAIKAHMTAFAYGGVEAFRDPTHELVRFTGVSVTPEVAVVAHGHVVYRGRVDDRFVDLGRERPAPTKHDLADALTATLAGKPVTPATTQAVGCVIADYSR